MIDRILHVVFITVVLVSCSAGLSSIENASGKYKLDKGYKNLEILYHHFYKGMQREEVERLLGDPDYSPINGQYYYSSAQSVYLEDQKREVVVGLVIDYRDINGMLTGTLQEFWLGPIGE